MYHGVNIKALSIMTDKNNINITNNISYMGLDSWILANIVQLATFDFCRKFLDRSNDPAGRMFDQMTQAARSGQANIAEGCARRQTSTETEMKLLDVARASLNELAGDYMFILMSRGEAAWPADAEGFKAIGSFRLSPHNYGANYLHDVMENIIEQKSRLDPWLKTDDVCIAANVLLILTQRVIRMLEKQISTAFERFKQEGGFTENLTKARMETIKKAAIKDGAPLCPKCGMPMVERMAKRGTNQESRFWGCSNYPKCDGTRKM